MHLRLALLSSFLFAAATSTRPLQHDSFVKRATDGSYNAGVGLTYSAFESVGSFMVLPQVSGDPGSGVEFWNGLVADRAGSCDGASFKAGVSCLVSGIGTTCKPWYRWGPYEMQYDNFTVAPGEAIGLDVAATSQTTGTIYITNSDGDSLTESLTAPEGWEYCWGNTRAQWMLSAVSDGDSFKPLANFGDVSFQWTMATSVDGQNYTAENGPITSNVVQDGRTLTYTHVEGATVMIIYLWTP